MTQATKLYQPEKYKVYLGKGRSSGLCTVWNEPETVFNKSKSYEIIPLCSALFTAGKGEHYLAESRS